MTDPKIPLPFRFQDERGTIQNLLFHPISSVALITSKKGTERSNHWHRKASHFLFVQSGRVRYHEKDLDGSNLVVAEYGPNEMFFTGPLKLHLCEFLEDTVMISMNTEPRLTELDVDDCVKQKFYE